jgi:NodT family efflux transporter outer membrane factor (OMF) lipoprotein
MKIKKLIAITLAAAVLTGFTPLEAFALKKNKPITTEETICSYVNIDWWKNFDDALLTEYILKALSNNQDLKIATLRVEEATEAKNITRANEMPSVSIGAVPALYKIPTQTKSDGLIALPAYASYELDLFGKNRDKTKSQDKIVEISRQNERSAYISVISAVGSTYYNIVKLDKLIEIQEQIIKDRKKIYELMQLSNNEGIVSTADTVRAYKAYLLSETDMTELMKTREHLLNILAVLTGDSPDNNSDYQRIAFDELVMNKNIPDCIATDVIEARPDYISAEKMIEKAGIDVRVAKKEFLPTFDILGLLSFNSNQFLKKLNWTNAFALTGVNAMLPLFTGGAKIANLKLNKNRYKQAVENYQKTNLTAIQEVNDALCDLKLDNEKYNKTFESYNAERKDFHYTELKYKEGIISNLDLLQKKEALLVTEKLLTSDKTSFFIDQIGLYKATAGADLN